ncbi:MAG: TrkH family potassium uptake protein [Alphaproteobacteria bacterium]
MRFKLIFSIVSRLIVICGVAMAIPGVLDYVENQPQAANRLFLAAAVTVLCGLTGQWVFRSEQEPLRPKEMFLTTTLVWTAFAFVSAIPFYFSLYNVSFTNAFFESMSGLTTTGATVFTHLDDMNHGLLLWRSLIQWLGGLGIVVLALTVLPTLHVGGMHFFATESSDRTDKSAPKVAQTLRFIIYFFLFLSVSCACCLWLAGMNVFDAVNHAMTTVATGGFSTKDLSIGYYQNPAAEWIIAFFMAVSGLPLIIGLYIVKRQWHAIKTSDQILTYFWFLFFSSAFLSLYRWYREGLTLADFYDILRSTVFNVVSIITTTGFITENYMLWGDFVIVFFLFLLMTGACTGSTSGGIKMFRFTIIFKNIGTRLKSMVQPYGVFVSRYGDKAITDDVLIGVMVFFGLYFLSAAAGTLVLSLAGMDLITSLSGTLSALSNVGPALGNVIGPDKTFATLPDTVKWIMSFLMLMGRLEFIAVIVLFMPYMWRKNT